MSPVHRRAGPLRRRRDVAKPGPGFGTFSRRDERRGHRSIARDGGNGTLSAASGAGVVERLSAANLSGACQPLSQSRPAA